MKMSATVKSKANQLDTDLVTSGTSKKLSMPVKPTGFGSAVNGGELLLLSLATCYCNDIYREAAKRGISVSDVHVETTCEFGGEGEPGLNFKYSVHVSADASDEEIAELIRHTDTVAEIHNTLRRGASVTLQSR